MGPTRLEHPKSLGIGEKLLWKYEETYPGFNRLDPKAQSLRRKKLSNITAKWCSNYREAIIILTDIVLYRQRNHYLKKSNKQDKSINMFHNKQTLLVG